MLRLSILSLMFFSSSAFADYVSWTVPASKVSVHTKNFQIVDHNVEMRCKLGDADNLFGDKFLVKRVKSKMNPGRTSFAGQGYIYSLTVEKTKMIGGSLYKDFSYCVYVLTVLTNKKRVLLEQMQIDAGAQVELEDEVHLLSIEDKTKLNSAVLPLDVSLEHITDSDQILEIED